MQAEAKLYHNRAMAWILPFLEYITGAVAVIAGIAGIIYFCIKTNFSVLAVLHGFFWGIGAVAPLLLIAAGMGMIKRNHGFVTVILGAELLTQIILGCFNLNFNILLILCYAGITAVYVFTFVKKIKFSNAEKAAFSAPFRKNSGNASEKASTVEAAGAVAKKFCSQCGAELPMEAGFCPKCGNNLK